MISFHPLLPISRWTCYPSYSSFHLPTVWIPLQRWSNTVINFMLSFAFPGFKNSSVCSKFPYLERMHNKAFVRQWYSFLQMAGLLTSCSLIVIAVSLLRKWKLHSVAQEYLTHSFQIQCPSNYTGILGRPCLTLLINTWFRSVGTSLGLKTPSELTVINRQVKNSTSSQR